MNHVCDVCKISFKSSSALKRHSRIHTGEKPHVCTMFDCGDSFVQYGQLKAHMKSHFPKQIQIGYICNRCGIKFVHPSGLSRHKRKVHSNLTCNVCGQTFISQTSLKTHSKIHFGEKFYKCDVCNQSFSHASTLESHAKSHEMKFKIIPELIKNLELHELKDVISKNKAIAKYMSDNKNYITKLLLKKYKVEYSDPGNLVYLKIPYPSSFSDILKEYLYWYNQEIVNVNDSQLTSIPILPKMKQFIGNSNFLTTFPEQPSMTHFYGNNNLLTDFPVQYNMTHFYAKGNLFSSLPKYPKLEYQEI